jgi:arylsulfatase A
MLPPKWPDIPLLEGNDTLELNPDQGKLTRLYTKRSIQFIEKNKDQPFFIYLPYAMPHVPLYASEKFSGRSKRGTYGDVVEEIDWSVGEILKTLENKQLDQNTLVFFTSDNGPWIIKGLEGGSAGLFRDGKGSTWEGGMRVPAIARWPGQIPAGSVNQSPVSVIDLFATFNNLAGVDSSKDHLADGQSLPSVLLQNETVAENRFLFFYGWRNELTAVRRGPWKLHIKTYSQTGIDYFDGQLPLLFNLNEDPSETQNVADQHPELVRQLQLAIEEHKAEVKQQASFFDQ